MGVQNDDGCAGRKNLYQVETHHTQERFHQFEFLPRSGINARGVRHNDEEMGDGVEDMGEQRQMSRARRQGSRRNAVGVCGVEHHEFCRLTRRKKIQHRQTRPSSERSRSSERIRRRLSK